jgi:hypothetical protein
MVIVRAKLLISYHAINRQYNEKKAKDDKGEGISYLLILIHSECIKGHDKRAYEKVHDN